MGTRLVLDSNCIVSARQVGRPWLRKEVSIRPQTRVPIGQAKEVSTSLSGGNRMSARKPIPVGTLFMGLVVALAAVGVGYGLWSKTLFIQGSVSAGDLNAVFVDAFTDDDGVVDN